MAQRIAEYRRETGETTIILSLNIDGTGKYEISTGVSMFDHMLSQMTKHGSFDLRLTAKGDDIHHLAEDIAICFGKAFLEALGERRGIVRMADSTVPMDDALSMAAVDISGRGYSKLDMTYSENDMLGFPTDLLRHFLETFALEARINLHVRTLYGTNDHHKAEAVFKALGKTLYKATRVDDLRRNELPSTKNWLES